MSIPVDRAPAEKPNHPNHLRLLRGTLMALVLELIIEGIARKINPVPALSTVIFFLKDLICVAIGLQLLRLRRPRELDFLWVVYLLICLLFLPLVVTTITHSLPLAVFGAKQYLLYPLVCFGAYLAFADASLAEVIAFFRVLALFVIPTAALALVELHLSPTNLLNKSVGGESLQAFAAGGRLRVSSTFPFVAQYCAFINAEVFITAIALNSLKDVHGWKKALYVSIVPLLLISSYVTGSRGAVLVNLVIIGIALGLSMMKFQARSALRVIAIILGLLITLVAAEYADPDAFVAYSVRQKGNMLGATTEIYDRIHYALFDWMGHVTSTPFLGNGIGVMSNGSELLSSYAAWIREFTWTETDYATTLFEGGIYLIVIWYGFRYYVIGQCLFRYFDLRERTLSVPAAFCCGFIFITGFNGSLDTQPPQAIWFWLGVGAMMILWRKGNEIMKDGPGRGRPVSTVPKIRGQSPYAARLHAQNRAS